MSDALRRAVRANAAALELAGLEFVRRAGPRPYSPVAEAEAAPPDPTLAVRVALDTLAAEVAACARCPGLFATRTQTVFGVGPLSPDVCFVGDAPRADDDRSGRPFTGDDGGLLDKILTAMNLGRAEVYLTTAIKCRPPGNRPPSADECGNCREHLVRQLEKVRPKVICCLGEPAARTLLETNDTLAALRGKVHDYRGTPVVCTYHPAAMLQNEKLKKGCWDDMKLAMATVGRPVGGKG